MATSTAQGSIIPCVEELIDRARALRRHGETGSKTLQRAEPLFVPERRRIELNQIVRDTTPGRSLPGTTIAAFDFATLGGVVLVAPIVGAAQGALDWFVATMKNKVKATLEAGQERFGSEPVGAYRT